MRTMISISDAANKYPLTAGKIRQTISEYNLNVETDDTGNSQSVDEEALDKLLSLLPEQETSCELRRKFEVIYAAVARNGFDKTMSIGAVFAALSAVFIAWFQVNHLIQAFHVGNNYQIQSNIAEALSAIYEHPDTPNFYITLLDVKMQSINDLYENSGISKEAWSALISRNCRALDKIDFTIQGSTLETTKEICYEHKEMWRK